jgi:tight adherence protein B
LYVLRRRAKRFRKFEEHFPDALDSLARALRAGHTFGTGVEIVTQECEPPVSTELRKAAAEANLGNSWEQALSNLSERMPLLEVSMFAAAVQMQTRTGGKLNEVLARLAENMREATSLKGEVRALAAHGKMTGMVLTVLPLLIAAVMMFVNPSYLTVLAYHPYGKYLISGAIICLVLAHFVIRRIVDIKV